MTFCKLIWALPTVVAQSVSSCSTPRALILLKFICKSPCIGFCPFKSKKFCVVQFSILVSRSTSFLFILFSRSSIKSSTNSNPKNFICESEYVALKPGLGGYCNLIYDLSKPNSLPKRVLQCHLALGCLHLLSE